MYTTTLHKPMSRHSAMPGSSSHDKTSAHSGLGALLRQWPSPATRPAQAKPRDRQAEAAEVREMACSFRQSDPGFASDLFAAADRHESAAQD